MMGAMHFALSVCGNAQSRVYVATINTEIPSVYKKAMHPRYFFRQTICLSCLYVLSLLPPPSCEAELWNDRQLRKRRAKEKDFANKADVVVGKGGRGEGPSVIIRPVRHHNHHHVFSAALSRL